MRCALEHRSRCHLRETTLDGCSAGWLTCKQGIQEANHVYGSVEVVARSSAGINVINLKQSEHRAASCSRSLRSSVVDKSI